MRKELAIPITIAGGIIGVYFVLIFANRNPQLQIDLPPGFHGKITIICDSLGSKLKSVKVDSKGFGVAEQCPKGGNLNVIRDGKNYEPYPPANWTWGDNGIPIRIEFAVDR